MSQSGLIHHLDLNVSDLERSRAFYDRVLRQLGYRPVDYSAAGDPAGFDWLAPASSGVRLSIGLYRARNPAAKHDRFAPGIHHLALHAESREQVDQLYQTLLQMKAEILDPPNDYPKYEPGYYAVFFLDPDGIKLECVFTP
jgi:glyoxylase I family protein